MFDTLSGKDTTKTLAVATNTGIKQRGPGRPFKPGQSGNPAGKPKGARHRTTLAVEALLNG